VIDVQRRILGDEHPNMLLSMNGLALLYDLQHKNAEAELLYTKVIESQRRVLGAEHPDTLGTMNTRAVLYVKQGKNVEAEPLATKAEEVRRRVLGEKHPDTLRSANNLGWLYLNERRYGQAESILREAFNRYQTSAPDSWERYLCESLLGASLTGQKRYQEAERLVIGGYEAMMQRKAAIPAGSSSA